MSKIDTTRPVLDAELIHRLIASPSCFSDDGEISADVFTLYHKDEDYVSVLRDLYCNHDEIMSRGPSIKRWLYPEDTFCGYVTLCAGEVRAISERLRVDSYYKETFKAHAGISYVLDDGSYLKHTGDEVLPAWLLAVQLQLCMAIKKAYLIKM